MYSQGRRNNMITHWAWGLPLRFEVAFGNYKSPPPSYLKGFKSKQCENIFCFVLRPFGLEFVYWVAILSVNFTGCLCQLGGWVLYGHEHSVHLWELRSAQLWELHTFGSCTLDHFLTNNNATDFWHRKTVGSLDEYQELLSIFFWKSVKNGLTFYLQMLLPPIIVAKKISQPCQ